MVRGFRDEDNERRGGGGEQRDPVTLYDVYGERETLLALLCVIPNGKRRVERWIPKSQIHDDSEVYRAGQTGKLVILGWFAEKEGLA